MRFLILIICFLVSSIGYSKTESNEVKLMQRSMHIESQYISLFDSIGDYMDQKEKSGVYTKRDKTEILAFLKTKKIDTNTKPYPTKVNKNEFSMGNFSIKLMNDGSIKTSQGNFLRLTKGLSASEAFTQAFLAFINAKPAQYSWNLFSATAYADDDTIRAVGAALYTASGYILSVPVGALGIAANVFCSGTVFPIDTMLYAIRKWKYEGKVECIDGSLYLLDYPSYASLMGKDFDKTYSDNFYSARGKGPVISTIAGSFAALCVGPIKGIFSPGTSTHSAKNRMFGDIKDKKIAQPIPEEVVKAVTGNYSTICRKGDTQLAEKIKKYLDVETTKLEDAVKQVEAERPASIHRPAANK